MIERHSSRSCRSCWARWISLEDAHCFGSTSTAQSRPSLDLSVKGHLHLPSMRRVVASWHETLIRVAVWVGGIRVGAGPDADHVSAWQVGTIGAAAVDDVD